MIDRVRTHARVGSQSTTESVPTGAGTRLRAGLRLHGAGWVADVFVIDAAVVAVAFVRYGGHIPGEYGGRRALAALGLITLGYTAFDLLFGVYRIVWRFATVLDMAALGLAVLGAFSVVAVVELTALTAYRPIPLSVVALGAVVAYFGLAHFKLAPRARQAAGAHRAREPLIVFGAGLAGIALVRQLAHERTGYRPVAFVDDDTRKVGRVISGIPVVGTRTGLRQAVQRYRAQAVAIALPSAHPNVVREISLLALDANARALALPSIRELMAGGDLRLHEVGIEEIVGRAEVSVDQSAIANTFTAARVLITGAAGSIGSELAKQVAALHPQRLDLVDNNESGLADLRDELAGYGEPIAISVTDIADQADVRRVMSEAQPQIVIHAAALKHVDIVEAQPDRAVDVNVRGTWICAKAAESAGVERFILISTDKAVDPVGVLGTTKRIGELMIASLRESPTRFAAVRFGNVLGSRGSVLPKFERQIRAGGPITITHPEVRRYFMSTVEAVRLVLQTTSFAEAGHTYILDMGEELSITSFAQRLVRLRGMRVPQDIQIVYTGLRPGERMTEALIGHSEVAQLTPHPKVMATVINDVAAGDWNAIIAELRSLRGPANAERLRSELLRLASAGPADLAESGPYAVDRTSGHGCDA